MASLSSAFFTIIFSEELAKNVAERVVNLSAGLPIKVEYGDGTSSEEEVVLSDGGQGAVDTGTKTIELGG